MSRTAFRVEDASYPKEAPFHPSERYPEYDGSVGKGPNAAYGMVRDLFQMLGLDEPHFGTEDWNPLGDIIHKGDTVLLKPNYVIHENGCGESVWAVITHPSVIRAVADYVFRATGREGRVVIADAPQADCHFEEVVRLSGLKELIRHYKEHGLELELYDLRQLRFEYKDGVLLEGSRIELDGDPSGYIIFDLGKGSSHTGISHAERIYGADYDRSEVLKHHSNGHHEYCISKMVMNADVVISMPKIKTHRKNGVTLNYKNFIGVNGNKNYLPHFRIGDPTDGGDEYEPLNAADKTINYTNRFLTDKLLAHPSKLKSAVYQAIIKAYKSAKKLTPGQRGIKKSAVRGGAWHGNDTLWRTVADLNQIIEFGGVDGKMHDAPQRRLFCVMDGIIAGEGNGPLEPKERHCGLMIAGDDLLAADLAAIRIMDIDYDKIHPYHELCSDASIRKRMDDAVFIHNLGNKGFSWDSKEEQYFRFEEADGWKGKISIQGGGVQNEGAI